MDQQQVEEHEMSTKIKTIEYVQFSNKFKIQTWYFSPLPSELQNLETLFVCESCLALFPEEFALKHHLNHQTETIEIQAKQIQIYQLHKEALTPLNSTYNTQF